MPKTTPTTTLRPAKLKDLPRLAELGLALLKYHQEFDPYFAPARDARATYLKYFRSCIYSRKKLLLVAESEDKIIAYSLANLGTRPRDSRRAAIHSFLRPPVFQIRKIGHLNDMFIAPQFRRQGLGKKLLAENYKWFKKHKITHIRSSRRATSSEVIAIIVSATTSLTTAKTSPAERLGRNVGMRSI